MPGEGCQAASGSAFDRHRGRKKEMKKEREEDSMGGGGRGRKLCAVSMSKKVMDEGQEVSAKPTTEWRDGIGSEKERNRASQLKNKCELIRSPEAYYITSALPCLNVLQRDFWMCVCDNVCVSMVHKRSFSLPETTVYLCVCIYTQDFFPKNPAVCMLFKQSVSASTHMHI